MKQLAVDWLLEQMLVNNYINKNQYDNCNSWLTDEAKEIEKQQKDEYAIEFVNWIINPDTTDLFHDLELFGEIDKEVTTKQLLEIYKKRKDYEKI